MKLRFRTFFRLYALAGITLLLWSLWASAQSAATNRSVTNNAAAAAATNNPAEQLALEIRSHEDYLTFRLDRVPVLKEIHVLGQPLWKYLASLIYVLLAFYVSKFLDFLTNAWLKRWSARTRAQFNQVLVTLLRGPVKIIAFVVLLNIGLDVFDWGQKAQLYLSKAFIIIVAVSLTYVILKVIDLLIGFWRERTAAGADRTFDNHLFPVISKSSKIFAVTVILLVTSSNLGINIITVLASLSVGALAVGLAAQDTLANWFGAVAVYVDKPFQIGDQIRVESVEGVVESIGLRSTRVRSLEGNHVIIPNKTIGSATITNITRRTKIPTEMHLGLAYDTSAESVRRALQILREIYRGHPHTADLTVTFNKFTDSALNIQIVHWWDGTDNAAQMAALEAMNLKVKERFDAEGIRFAFPSRMVYLK